MTERVSPFYWGLCPSLNCRYSIGINRESSASEYSPSETHPPERRACPQVTAGPREVISVPTRGRQQSTQLVLGVSLCVGCSQSTASQRGLGVHVCVAAF